MHLKPTGTIVMPSMYMLRYGITGDDMRFRKARRIPTRWKATMRNSDTIWRVWHALPGVSPDVRMLSTVQFGYLSTTSICANYVNTNSRSTPSTSPTSFPHPFSHSLVFGRLTGDPFKNSCMMVDEVMPIVDTPIKKTSFTGCV